MSPLSPRNRSAAITSMSWRRKQWDIALSSAATRCASVDHEPYHGCCCCPATTIHIPCIEGIVTELNFHYDKFLCAYSYYFHLALLATLWPHHVFECCFPAPLFWNPIVSSPLYFASIPLIPGLFIIVFSPLHLDAHIYSMSMPPKFLPFTEVLGILTDKRPWYHVFSEASSWYTIGLSVVAAGSALTWRGGTASVAADVSA